MTPSKNLILICIIVFLASPHFLQAQGSRVPYDLGRPDEEFILPSVLYEISGNALLNLHTMVCIQDQKGKLFFYDLVEKTITKQIGFAKDGDVEDLTLVGNTAWALKSNGKLYSINSFENEAIMKVTDYKTPLSKANNCEGLCYDPVDEALLIACKGIPSSKNYFVDDNYRAIYKFDLKRKTFIEKPAYLIDLNKLIELLTIHKLEKGNTISFPEELKDFKFEPSAITIHPITKEIWVMASVGKAIAILDRKGEIRDFVHLDRKILRQPEGMTFSPGGTLYISSEGAGGYGKILKFEMKY